MVGRFFNTLNKVQPKTQYIVIIFANSNYKTQDIVILHYENGKIGVWKMPVLAIYVITF